MNVDHQTSQRTPNLSGQSRDELTLLGLKLMYQWAEEDKASWSPELMVQLNRRAWQDAGFVKTFEQLLKSGAKKGLDYNLRHAYDRIIHDGWDKHFPPLPGFHPLRILGNIPQ